MTLQGEVYGSLHHTNCLAYKWVLRDFNSIVSKFSCPGTEIRSDYLGPKKDSIAKNYLSLYPGGHTSEDAEYVSLFVNCSSSRKEIYQKYKLKVETSTGKIIHSSSGYVSMTTDLGYYRFVKVKRKTLLEQLKDDVLVVSVEMTYSLSIVQKHGGAVKDVVELSPLLSASEDLLSAMNQGRHSDVRICVGGTEIPAHKFVLAARSKVFSAMFDHDVIENSTRKIDVTDFDAGVVKALLRFMYSGTVEDMDTFLAKELLRAADKYDMEDLKSFCTNFLTSQMDEQNAIELLIAADTYNAKDLRKEGIEYVCDESHSVAFQKCKTMLAGYSDLLVDIITRMKERFSR